MSIRMSYAGSRILGPRAWVCRLVCVGVLGLLGMPPAEVAAATRPGTAATESERNALPSGAELIARDRKEVRPEYLACMAQAGSDLPRQKVCVDAEYAYQDGELNRLYKQVMAELPEADRPYMRKSQRKWVKFIYSKGARCLPLDQATLAQQIDSQQCLIHSTLMRIPTFNEPLNVASVLSSEKSPSTPPRFVAPVYYSTAEPDAQGMITLRPRNYDGEVQAVLRLQVDPCKKVVYSACHVRSASIEQHGKTYKLQPLPPQIMYDKLPGPDVSMLELSDLNKDGRADLMLWTGQDGNYGSASYAFYLYDPKVDRFVENKALKAAVDGHQISDRENNRFMLYYKSGPCVRGEQLIEVRGTRVVTVRKRDYDTCKGDRPTETEFFDISR